MKVSLVIPGYNNLRHLKNAYNSVRKYYTDKVELILIDDGSNDGTIEWLESLKDNNLKFWREEQRIGHTILYDKGIEKASNDIVGILHADMYIAPNYVENLIKHLKPGTVVCATRVEPPLHPEGKEKIIQDFGLDFDSLKIEDFYNFSQQEMVNSKDKTTKGMFAPWVLYKKDYLRIGGHDHGFAPFPYEDSDIFQRWILSGYELLQSRDALVYHLTCRGHRWNDKAGGEIGKNDNNFQVFEAQARKYYLKKWGSWIKNDELGHPILSPVYGKKLILHNSNPNIEQLKDWFNGKEDIIVEINGNNFTQQDFMIIQQLNDIIKDSGEIGEFRLGNLKITINNITDYSKDLIKYEG
jgi:glycosyltransferase involved in cell wall biosynthesis